MCPSHTVHYLEIVSDNEEESFARDSSDYDFWYF